MQRPQRLARRQETHSAAVYGGRVVPRSGSGDLKGDILTDAELIECKHTERKSFSVVLADFLKHATHALLQHRRPLLEIEFTDPDGRNAHHLVVLHRDEYLGMRDELAHLHRLVGTGLRFGGL